MSLCERTLLDIFFFTTSRSHTSGEINLLGRAEKNELGRAEHVCMLFPETGKESVRAGYTALHKLATLFTAFNGENIEPFTLTASRIYIYILLSTGNKHQGLYS